LRKQFKKGLFPRIPITCLKATAIRDLVPQPHAWPTAVPCDELNAGGLEGSPDHLKCRASRLAAILLKLMDGHDSYSCMVGQILLAPVE
jgi:hypothetical protein